MTNLGDSGGRLFQIINGPEDVTIDHNTGFCTSAYGFSENNPKSDQFVFRNNIVTQVGYGFTGTGTGNAIDTLNTFFTNWQFTNNAIIGGIAGNYPSGNYFPSSIAAVSFVDASGEDYRLSASSPYKKAGTDGKDLGANFDAPAPPLSLRIVK